MGIDAIALSIWKHKIRARQSRLKNYQIEKPLQSLDDYLEAANQIALDYFRDNTNLFRRLWEYQGLEPQCGSHSTYTYAAFLSLTTDYGKPQLQEDVRLVSGMYVSDKNHGSHLWLEKRVNGEWEVFETIPEMRDTDSMYAPWYTFQIKQDDCTTSSEHFGGLFALYTEVFTNS